MFNMNLSIQLENLRWSSDWNGYEVGYDDIDVVGLYTQYRENGEYNFYIDMETNAILELWKSEDEEFIDIGMKQKMWLDTLRAWTSLKKSVKTASDSRKKLPRNINITIDKRGAR